MSETMILEKRRFVRHDVMFVLMIHRNVEVQEKTTSMMKFVYDLRRSIGTNKHIR